MTQITYYEACENSDLTEGKGRMVPFAYFENLSDAVKAVKGRGVMGVGDGEVFQVTVIPAGISPKTNPSKRDKVYGYRKNYLGKWDYGYVDNRDAPTNDPEWEEFVRLQKKFGGTT